MKKAVEEARRQANEKTLLACWKIMEDTLRNNLGERQKKIRWEKQFPEDPAPMDGSIGHGAGFSDESLKWTYRETQGKREQTLAFWIQRGNAQAGIQLTITQGGRLTLHRIEQEGGYNALTRTLQKIIQKGTRDTIAHSVFAPCVQEIINTFLQREKN